MKFFKIDVMPSYPQHLAIMLTEYCNLNCYHCYRHITHQKSDLNLDILLKLSEKVKDTSINSLRITGGEPLMLKDIEKLIRTFSSYGLHTSIGTNGTLLNSSKINLIKDAGLNEIWISVHSINSDTHDNLSGKIGSFHLMLNAIKECIRQNISLNVNFPVSKYNIQDTLPTLKFLDNLGVKRIKLLQITPIGKAGNNTRFEHIDDEDWIDLAKKVSKIKLLKSTLKIQGCPPDSELEGKCSIYSFKYLNLSPTGFVFPCCLLTNLKGMEIGHISEILNEDWQRTVNLFSERIKEKYNLSKNPIPCLVNNKKRKVCPLYSKEIHCDND